MAGRMRQHHANSQFAQDETNRVSVVASQMGSVWATKIMRSLLRHCNGGQDGNNASQTASGDFDKDTQTESPPFHGIHDEEFATFHSLRLLHEFPTNAEQVNESAKRIFLEQEEKAKDMVVEFMEQNANVVLPPVVKFEGVDSAVSVYRLATFTGTRFFRSCALNVQSMSSTPSAPPLTRTSSNHSAQSMPARAGSAQMASVSGGAAGFSGSSPSRTAAGIFAPASTGESDPVQASHTVGSAPTMLSSGFCDEEPAATGTQHTTKSSTSTLPGGIDLQECDARTLSCLLRIVESKAHVSVSLAQACDLFSAVEYCLADKLRDLLFDYLEPMVAALTAKEVIWLLYGIVRECSNPESPLRCADRLLLLAASSPAFTTPSTDSPPATSPHAPHAMGTASESSPNLDNTTTTTTAAAATAAGGANVSVSAAQPSSSSSTRNSNNSNSTTMGAASTTTPQTSSSEAVHDLAQFTSTVMSALDDRYTEALLLLCSSSDVPCWIRSGCLIAACMSVYDTVPSDALVTAAQIAAEHVLYACVSASCPTAASSALQKLLSEACSTPLHSGQAELLTAVVQHVAIETHALSKQPQCMSMRLLLSSDPSKPELFSIPLKYSSRLLLMAKVTVPSLGTNIKSSILHGWSLNVKTAECTDKTQYRPGTWLPVSLFLQNHLSVPRKVSFLVGLTPARVDGADGMEEDQLAMMASLHDICSTEGDLAQVSMRMPWTWPVLMEAPTESVFKEEVACWGYTTLRVPQQQQLLLKRCCNCNGTDEWAGRVVYAFACVEKA